MPNSEMFYTGAYLDSRGVNAIGSGEAEMRVTPNGQEVTTIQVCVGSKQNEKYPDNWYSLTFWAEAAKVVNEIGVWKGKKVNFHGQLVQRKFNRKGGGQGVENRVILKDFQYHDGKQWVEIVIPKKG